MPLFSVTRSLRLALAALPLLAGTPGWAASDMARAETACTAAAKARNLGVTGVDAVRAAGGNTIEVSLRVARGAPVVCSFDERTGGTSFPGAAPAATPAAAANSPTTRAAEACTAAAKQQGIRVGKLEGVQAVGNDYDVRYARPFFGKPQTCRYETARRIASFPGAGGVAALPAMPAETDPATAQAAGEACLTIARARGMMESQVVSVRPLGGDLHEVIVRFSANANDPTERCRYNAQTRAAAPM
jgi:hypothetical protein